MDTDKKEETQGSLLKELCGADAELYALLSFYLYANPLAALSNKSLEVLTQEAEATGNFRPALDKAIFEGAQNPGDRERYISIIQDLSSKTIGATEKAKEEREKEGSDERVASLGRKIDDQKFISSRVGDILDVAAKFYSEKLLEQEESVQRDARDEARRKEEKEERRIGEVEEKGRGARRKERRKMSRKEKREAKERDKIEDLAAKERKQTREAARKETAEEERKIADLEKTERAARRTGRSEN